ncbi:hypothetical protein [Peribacillus simplex]
MIEKWNGKDMADVSGQIIVITGANSGLGFGIAEAPCVLRQKKEGA